MPTAKPAAKEKAAPADKAAPKEKAAPADKAAPKEKDKAPPRASSNPVPSPREGGKRVRERGIRSPRPAKAGRGSGERGPAKRGTTCLLRERREHGTAARIRPLVFLRVGLRRRVAAEVSVGARDQAIDRLVARRGHRPIEVGAVNHDLEQD